MFGKWSQTFQEIFPDFPENLPGHPYLTLGHKTGLRSSVRDENHCILQHFARLSVLRGWRLPECSFAHFRYLCCHFVRDNCRRHSIPLVLSNQASLHLLAFPCANYMCSLSYWCTLQEFPGTFPEILKNISWMFRKLSREIRKHSQTCKKFMFRWMPSSW